MNDLTTTNTQLSQWQQWDSLIMALDDVWINDNTVAEWLKHILQNATKMDIKGNVSEDFETKLKALQTVIKIKNPKYWWNNINIAMFTPPPMWQPLKY
jgi:hypothetical protein